ncbi:hypothetical protein BLA29_001816 [Euroglyphus maynei]|uniref:Uncharacterized protein n=1 Tax=Euroglyphus maynei TaxID=6958 RepID=A0A1Y3B4N4_EURMA|nr:hypothetical protein BLA29_001816 [Euroglyphus maynei]
MISVHRLSRISIRHNIYPHLYHSVTHLMILLDHVYRIITILIMILIIILLLKIILMMEQMIKREMMIRLLLLFLHHCRIMKIMKINH